MHWYLVHTKPRQEQRALLNLTQQGYPCYLPLFPRERLRQGALQLIDEPLFPRYLFIRLNPGQSGQNWAPIRSTQGVCRIVTFGSEPARADARLIDALRAQSAAARQPQPLFAPGEALRITEGPFAGIEALYQMADGTQRAMVLIELLSKPVALKIALSSLRKVD